MMQNSYKMRPFEPSDMEYEAIVRVFNRAEPHGYGSVQTWQHWDQHRDPARLFTRHVLEREGEIVGYGYSMCTDPETNTFRFAAYFLPDYQTTTLVDKFYGYIMRRCLVYSPTALICQTREDEPDKIAWLKNQGFREVMRYPCSILNVDSFDPRSYDALQAKLVAQGIAFVSLVELAERNPEWQRKVYDLEMLLSQDVPRPSTFVPPPFEKYAQSMFEDPGLLPELWFFALDGEELVGMTSLYTTTDSLEILENDLTGVRRVYRRRGLATALKCKAIEGAQRLGAQRIVTYNEENNPMYQLNLQLGFQPQPADVDWEKKDLSDLPGF